MQWNPFSDKADIIFYNGRIYSLSQSNDPVEALAIADGKVLGAGSMSKMEKLKGSGTRMWDLEGNSLFPAFIEGHAHFSALGRNLQTVDLRNFTTWREIVDTIRGVSATTPENIWIEARGWHQEKWTESFEKVEGFPTSRLLDEAVPDHPVILKHASGHALLANKKAVKIAEVHVGMEVQGGRIVTNKEGEMTGLFEENAMGLITAAKVRSDISKEDKYQLWKEAAERAQQECFRHGITALMDAGVDWEELEFYRRGYEEGWLKIYIKALWQPRESDDKDQMKNLKDLCLPHFDCNGIKIYSDGALGSYGALLLQPYTDKREAHGHLLTSLERMRELISAAAEHDVQVYTHAIGDSANRLVLDLYEQALNKEDHRWRIEHAQHIDLRDIPRFGKLGVIASVQAVHCTSDMPFVVKRLGTERAARGAYPWQSIMNYGGRVVNGTDAPVEKIDPMAGLYALCTRHSDSQGFFYPGETLSRLQALYSYIPENAFALFTEDKMGDLSPGKWANMVILDRDILICPVEMLKETQVLNTFLRGEEVYHSDKTF